MALTCPDILGSHIVCLTAAVGALRQTLHSPLLQLLTHKRVVVDSESWLSGFDALFAYQRCGFLA